MNSVGKRTMANLLKSADTLGIFCGYPPHTDWPSLGIGPNQSGELDGLWIGLKANIAVKDNIWSAGIPARQNTIASRHAKIVSKL
jgi:hypothetical protein